MPIFAEIVSRHCAPLKGPANRLSSEDIQGYLHALPAGWILIDQGQAVRKTFKFDDYHKTMAFVNALAFIAHREDHHPDLSVHYNKVEVRFSTHDVGGLSTNDFICAAKTDQLLL
jgi:4a-hydroxytetrahydrobiopterin dehydratase